VHVLTLQTAFIHSRHALVTSLVLELEAPDSTSLAAEMHAQDALDAIALGLVGTRYAGLEGAERNMDEVPVDIVQEVLAWLRAAM
jgi:lipoate-protein ligase A